ncbi:MipA/OmpV family protein [Neptunicella sp. SCSIO 80796]|uniref:MipA/OmpV family protein n=1 Tax=Neptunicella plasticusilytica TaxID=3117012 RepID=UPI003A4DCBAA
MSKFVLACGWLATVLLAHSTLCQASEDYFLEVGAGLVAGQIPEYPGSAQARGFVLPFPYIDYRDDKLTIDRQAIKGELFDSGQFRISLSASGTIPVDNDEGKARDGMPELGWVGELGPSLIYDLNRNWQVKWQVRKATSWRSGKLVNVGWRSELGIGWQQDISSVVGFGKMALQSELSLNFADHRYHQFYYGVEQQYVTADRHYWQARSGVSYTRLSLGLTWRYQQLWLGLYAKYDSFEGAANRQSSLLAVSHQSGFGLAVAWIFLTHDGGKE